MKLYFQGDLCLEPVATATINTAQVVSSTRDGAVVLAYGEATGHRHAFYDSGVSLFYDWALARDLPAELYIGHIRIDADAAELRHEEHDTIRLPKGVYRVRRQREYDGSDVMHEPRPSVRSHVVAD
jgi:hypothetical protein